jgi:hypothetical protein
VFASFLTGAISSKLKTYFRVVVLKMRIIITSSFEFQSPAFVVNERQSFEVYSNFHGLEREDRVLANGGYYQGLAHFGAVGCRVLE